MNWTSVENRLHATPSNFPELRLRIVLHCRAEMGNSKRELYEGFLELFNPSFGWAKDPLHSATETAEPAPRYAEMEQDFLSPKVVARQKVIDRLKTFADFLYGEPCK